MFHVGDFSEIAEPRVISELCRRITQRVSPYNLNSHNPWFIKCGQFNPAVRTR